MHSKANLILKEMKLKTIKFGVALIAAITLMSCGSDISDKHLFPDLNGVTGDNGIDKNAKAKRDSGNANCFYRGPDRIPGRSTNQDEYLKGQVIFIGHNKRTGAFQRFQLDAKTTANLESLLKARDYAGFQSTIPTSGYVPYDYSSFGREITNPFDLNINWYSVLGFVLIDPSETFDQTSPFRTIVSVKGAKSPFRSFIRQSDQSVIVEYTSLPPKADIRGWDKISKRDCDYYYDLHIVQTSNIGTGNPVSVPITLDPGSQNDGPPSGGDEPPGWP